MKRNVFFSWAFIFILNSFFSCKSAPVYEARLSEPLLLEPESFEMIEAGKSRLNFKSAKPKAAVYLNGEFQGLTPLVVQDLIPGRYLFELKKEGFKSVTAAVQVRDGMSDFFYFEMQVQDSESESEAETENPSSAGTLVEEP